MGTDQIGKPRAVAGCAEIEAGTFAPAIHFLVSADISSIGVPYPNGFGDSRSADFDTPQTLPRDGSQVQLASFNDGYPSNGKAAIVATVMASATETSFSTDASLQLNLTSDLLARSGCCGGLHPGSTIAISYVWTSQMDLPDNGGKWRLRVSLSNGMQAVGQFAPTRLPALAVRIDGEVKSVPGDQTYAAVTFDLEAGIHAIQVSQPAWGINARDSGSVVDSTLRGTLSLLVAAEFVASGVSATAAGRG